MVYADRHVDLILTDFVMDPYEVAATLAVRPHYVARKGDPVGKRPMPMRCNYMVVRHSFPLEELWSEAMDALMLTLGGWQEVEHLLMRLRPTDRMVQFTLPINNSPHQENNFVEAATLVRLSHLGVDLGLEFGEYRSPDDHPNVLPSL